MQTNLILSKWLAVGIILLFIGTAIIPSNGQQIEKISLPTSTGNTLYVGGSGPGNYTRIIDAISNSSDGDTIFVYHGTYQEKVTIDKAINLVGENRFNTTITGYSTYVGKCINIVSAYVNVSGFTLKNSAEGLRISSGINHRIFNNIIENNGNFGILIMEPSQHNQICNNSIYNNGDGLSCDGDTDCSIFNNEIYSNGDGICLYGSSYTHVASNNIYGNGIGVYVSSPNAIIKNNNIDSNSKDAKFKISRLSDIYSFLFEYNYWGLLKYRFKIIPGVIEKTFGSGYYSIKIRFPWFALDLNLRNKPYNISSFENN
ncbi:MAG TPA: NosD domain-containing protein [Candidatus Thermoplasmatota archaeon]|nr:NosD domain-containing protein [Candidatus Thermoplasmatota archaeon]